MVRDPVVLAIASIATGATASSSIVTTGLLVFRNLTTRHFDSGSEAAFLFLAITILIAVATSVAITWNLTAQLNDIWRRGVSCALSAMGGIFLIALTAPLDGIGGAATLLAYLVVLLLALAYSAQKARNAT